MKISVSAWLTIGMLIGFWLWALLSLYKLYREEKKYGARK